MGGAAASSLYNYGSLKGDDNGPNACNTNHGDDIVGCLQLKQKFGSGDEDAGTQILHSMCMSCCCDSPVSSNTQQTARSQHPGGVNMAFADGSTHFITDFVNVTPSAESGGLSVWDRLIGSRDGWAVNASEY